MNMTATTTIEDAISRELEAVAETVAMITQTVYEAAAVVDANEEVIGSLDENAKEVIESFEYVYEHYHCAMTRSLAAITSALLDTDVLDASTEVRLASLRDLFGRGQ